MLAAARTGFDRLLRPRSVAVVGGGVWCANVVEQCRKIGFAGEIWPVHPRRDTLGGVTAFRGVSDLPAAPDATFIGVNSASTIDVVRALSLRGAGGAVCFASGFREAEGQNEDGAAKQAALLDAAGAMTILGPNCYGILNYLDGVALWPDQHGGVRVDRGVAIVTQSSNIAINLTMQDRGLPVAYVVTAGNQAQSGIAEIARALLSDPRVTALGVHVEGFDDLRALEALAEEARALAKPIVALKVGVSDHARAATISHTASLAGSEVGARALLKRLGIGQVYSLPELLETLKLLHVAGPLKSNRIASMSCSGGEAGLMADAAHHRELTFPPLQEAQVKGLRAALGPSVALANPLDYHTRIWGDVDALAATFTAMMQGDVSLGCVVLDLPRSDRCDPAAWEPVLAAACRARTASGRPVAILASLKEALPEAWGLRAIEMGLVPLAGIDEGLKAIEVAAQIGQSHKPEAALVLPSAPRAVRTLSEADAKAVLGTMGVWVPAGSQACGAEAAAEAASQLGFPVVLKGEGTAHKTDAGAVVLDLSSTAAVLTAARTMGAERFLVEKMVTGHVAELLIGVVADQSHGYVLTIAAGGTLTELWDDSVPLLVPTDRPGVHDALHTLRIMRLLEGYRNGPAADLDAILDVVMAVQAYVASARPQEVEINPLMCGPNGAIAADALIRIGD